MTTLEADINWVWPWPPQKSAEKAPGGQAPKAGNPEVGEGWDLGRFFFDLKVCTELSSLEFRRFIPPEFLFFFQYDYILLLLMLVCGRAAGSAFLYWVRVVSLMELPHDASLSILRHTEEEEAALS